MQVKTSSKSNNGEQTIIALSNHHKSSTSGKTKRTNNTVTYNVFSKLAFLTLLILITFMVSVGRIAEGTVLMRVCDTREIKTVTSRVCMLYKRTKNSDVKLDRQGNLRMARDTKGEYSPEKLANDCCKVGCPPHIFAYNC